MCFNEGLCDVVHMQIFSPLIHRDALVFNRFVCSDNEHVQCFHALLQLHKSVKNMFES